MLAELDESHRLAALLDALQALAAATPARSATSRSSSPTSPTPRWPSARGRHPEVELALDAPPDGAGARRPETGLRAALDNLLENAARHGARR